MATPAASKVKGRQVAAMPGSGLLHAVPKVNLIARSTARSQQEKKPRSKKRHSLRYKSPQHKDIPHVVKFSGGRSSGMLLFILLENGLLKPERGDVVIFNNTSAEHPETYTFTKKCKQVVEEHFGIPFFWVEFQTYEDSRSGKWTRLPSYKLVTSTPRSESEPHGYSSKGEVFEELLSWTGFVPNQFSRTCTKNLKLEATRLFLQDWLACKKEIPRLGHYYDESRLTDDILVDRHNRNGGKVPKKILLEKKGFLRARPLFRPAQRFCDFSKAFQQFANPLLEKNAYGGTADLGEDDTEYVSFIGLRNDEMRRVARIKERDGEHLYMPLADMSISREDVNTFWNEQDWNLELPSDASLSNCVYCFLKGVGNLQNVQTIMGDIDDGLKDTPSDIKWWKKMERTYGRSLKAEGRQLKKSVPNNFIGFFGTSGFSYELLEQNSNKNGGLERYASSLLPCDCTD